MLKFFIFYLLIFSSTAFCNPLESIPATKNDCGISPALEKYGTKNIDKTLEGDLSRPGDWPWLISLQSEEMGCSGTLISNKWILTAAHCVMYRGGGEVENLTAFAGSNKHLEGQELEILKYIYHPLYVYGRAHDIALVQIKDVKFNEKIHPICLSTKVSKLPRKSLVAVGWGKVWNGNESISTRLLHEDFIPIQPWSHCFHFNESNSEICAGEGMHAVYHGDSGGPLMEIISNKFYEIGITSRGIPARDSDINENSNFEDIFTYIPAYCNWIAETTNGDVECEGNPANMFSIAFVLFITVIFKFVLFIEF